MENGLIIGRNYLDENHPITENNGQPIKDGEIGQQSEKIWDKGVSRRHLLLSKSESSQNPYHLELLRLDSELYVDNEKYSGKDINGYEKIELGKYRYRINIKNAIKDFKNKMTEVGGIPPTEITDSGVPEGDKPLPPSQLPHPSIQFPINLNKLFNIANITIVGLLILAVILKGHPTAHAIVLFMLTIALLFDLFIYTKKGNNKTY